MSHFIEHLSCFYLIPSLLTPTDSNYNAKSINNHNHDHNEHSNWAKKKRWESFLRNRWRRRCRRNTVMQNKRKSIKWLKILFTVICEFFFKYNTNLMHDACEYPQLLHLWCSVWLVHSSVYLCTTVYLWTLVLVRWSNRQCNIQFKWQFYQIYNIIFILIAICHLPDA